MITQHLHYVLVGGFNSSEKYASQLGWLFPTEWKKNTNVPTTNQFNDTYRSESESE